MKQLFLLPILVAAVFTPALIAQSPPTASATARLVIPAKPGKTFDLAWVGKIVRVSDPELSPDGKLLVAVVTKNDYENDLNDSELALVDVATGKTRSLTHDRKKAGFPRWSPAGDRVAFLAPDEKEHNQIFVLDMAGGDALQVTKSPTSIQQFAWKPDGSAVFRDRLPLHTLNESFSPTWGTSVPALAHVQSIFGTNVYITDGAPLISVENVHAVLLRSTYIIGCMLIFGALVLLAMGSKLTTTRAQSAVDA